MVKHTSELLNISLNGDRTTVPAGLTVTGLLAHLDIAPDRVAVELNRSIVRQPEWDSAEIGAGAEVEIVQFVGGG